MQFITLKNKEKKKLSIFSVNVFISFISSIHHACGRRNWTRHCIITRPVNHLASGSMSKRSTNRGPGARCRGCRIRTNEGDWRATAGGRVGAHWRNRTGVHGRSWRGRGGRGIGSYWLTAGCNCKKRNCIFVESSNFDPIPCIFSNLNQ